MRTFMPRLSELCYGAAAGVLLSRESVAAFGVKPLKLAAGLAVAGLVLDLVETAHDVERNTRVNAQLTAQLLGVASGNAAAGKSPCGCGGNGGKKPELAPAPAAAAPAPAAAS